MQIEPIEFKGKGMEINSEIEKIEFIKKVLYVSISYYAMATELRLLAASYPVNEENLMKKENQKSKMYHLNAI